MNSTTPGTSALVETPAPTTITVRVGEANQEIQALNLAVGDFAIREDLIDTQFPMFQEIFDRLWHAEPLWKEGCQEKLLRLPDDISDVFNIYVQWTYTRRIICDPPYMWCFPPPQSLRPRLQAQRSRFRYSSRLLHHKKQMARVGDGFCLRQHGAKLDSMRFLCGYDFAFGLCLLRIFLLTATIRNHW
jgi:hypothetical protein